MKPGSFIYGFTTYLRAFRKLLPGGGLFKYAILPFLINLVILTLIVYLGFSQYGTLMEYLLPGRTIWWQVFIYWLSWIIFPIVFLAILFYCFISIAAIVSSPFLELLSSKYLQQLNPKSSFKRTLPFHKIMWEETKKILVILLIAIIAFPLNFIPVAGNALYFLISVLLFSFEFVDYPMSVSEWTFKKRYRFIFRNIFTSTGLGIAITVSFIIPLVGFLCLPVSTIAATKIFHDLGEGET